MMRQFSPPAPIFGTAQKFSDFFIAQNIHISLLGLDHNMEFHQHSINT